MACLMYSVRASWLITRPPPGLNLVLDVLERLERTLVCSFPAGYRSGFRKGNSALRGSPNPAYPIGFSTESILIPPPVCSLFRNGTQYSATERRVCGGVFQPTVVDAHRSRLTFTALG